MYNHTQDKPVTVYDLLSQSARSALKLQREDGSFPPSQNAHYEEQLTPVRTTSHWMVTFSELYRIEKNSRYKEAAENAANYLLSSNCRPYGKSFHARISENKDSCNGLMGQAIPIWALAKSYKCLKREDLLELAIEVAQFHPFDKSLGVWNRVEIDGTILSFDRTLNHQIAFAAAISEIDELCEEVSNELNCFLSNLKNRMETRQQGLIRHLMKTPYITRQSYKNIKQAVNSAWNRLFFELNQKSTSVYEKEVGYHSVNLLWLSKIKNNLPQHPVWGIEPLSNAIEYIYTKEYHKEINGNYLGFTETLTGIHNATAIKSLGDKNKKVIQGWIETQINRSYDESKSMLGKDASSPSHVASEACHLTEFIDLELFTTKNEGKS